ncbi:MAG: hypothetical protein NVSMB31_12630 [Vulcanimicrobiaceae bacterium]
MSEEKAGVVAGAADELIARVRRLVAVFNETDLVRLRVSDEAENAIELRRSARIAPAEAGRSSLNGAAGADLPASRLFDVIKADLVGIAHLSKPAPTEGLQLEGDRELAYVEALGSRNPVRSLGSGRVISVLIDDGDAVDYGQPLFEIERV